MLVVPYSQRPDLVERLGEVEDVWPEFIHQTGETFQAHWNRVRREFPDLQLVLYDDDTDTLVGRGQTIPSAGTAPSRISRTESTAFFAASSRTAASRRRCRPSSPSSIRATRAAA